MHCTNRYFSASLTCSDAPATMDVTWTHLILNAQNYLLIELQDNVFLSREPDFARCVGVGCIDDTSHTAQ